MKTLADIQNTLTCSIFSLSFSMGISKTEFASQEIGYEINEGDLADELAAGLPTSISEQPTPQVDPDDFDTIYKWFLS